MRALSFSLDVKDELAKFFPPKNCCLIAELIALVQTVGVIRISEHHHLALNLNTENAAVARKMFRLLKKVFRIQAEIIVRRRLLLRKSNVYQIRVMDTDKVKEIMQRLDIAREMVAADPIADTRAVQKECCRRAYLRGAFLGCGSLSTPAKTYHLEFVTKEENYSQALCQLLNGYELNAKVNRRKNDYVIYIKDGNSIGELLSLMGAHTALLEFENVRIVKEMRNNVNRVVNCETSNLRKTVDAAFQQRLLIESIQARIGLHHLPDSLRDTAELRLRYPEASLKELGEMLEPPVGKSGIRHRLDRLKEIADKLAEGRV